MKQSVSISRLPLLKSEAVIIERRLVAEEPTSTGSKFGDVLWREVKALPEFPFALPDLFFCKRALTYIRHGSHKLEAVWSDLQRASQNVDMLDSAIRNQQTMLNIKICASLDRAIESLLHVREVVRVDSLKHRP